MELDGHHLHIAIKLAEAATGITVTQAGGAIVTASVAAAETVGATAIATAIAAAETAGAMAIATSVVVVAAAPYVIAGAAVIGLAGLLFGDNS
jgi:hypothetical protein